MPKIPEEILHLLQGELASGGLRYMLAMHWQGRLDKISPRILPALEWVSRNCLPAEQASSFSGSKLRAVSFVGLDHNELLNMAVAKVQERTAHRGLALMPDGKIDDLPSIAVDRAGQTN